MNWLATKWLCIMQRKCRWRNIPFLNRLRWFQNADNIVPLIALLAMLTALCMLCGCTMIERNVTITSRVWVYHPVTVDVDATASKGDK
jgi:hypothetical protein